MNSRRCSGRDVRFIARPPAQIRTCGFPAYGSCLGCVTAQVAVYAPAPMTREPGSESSTCFAGAYSPWPPPFAPPTPLRPPPQTPPRWASLALFAGFIATMTRSDFSCPCIIGYGSSPSRCGPSLSRDADGQTRDLPASDAIPLRRGGSATSQHWIAEFCNDPYLLGLGGNAGSK